jgi:hypothetical protein
VECEKVIFQTHLFDGEIKKINVTLYGGRDALGAASLHWRGRQERAGSYLPEKGV